MSPPTLHRFYTDFTPLQSRVAEPRGAESRSSEHDFALWPAARAVTRSAENAPDALFLTPFLHRSYTVSCYHSRSESVPCGLRLTGPLLALFFLSCCSHSPAPRHI